MDDQELNMHANRVMRTLWDDELSDEDREKVIRILAIGLVLHIVFEDAGGEYDGAVQSLNSFYKAMIRNLEFNTTTDKPVH